MEGSFPLQDRVAVVTGSTKGIGFAIASAFAQAGARVILSGRNSDAIADACSKLVTLPDMQISGIQCDVRNLQSVESLAEQVLAQFEKIDIWVNNAGIAGPYAAVADIPSDRWRDVIDTNLYGTYHGTKVALKAMLPRNAGKIINLQGAGDRDSAFMKFGYMSAYATSKAAVRRFTLAVADEYRDTNLSILGLNPGLIATDLITKTEPLTDVAAAKLKGLDLALALFTTPLEKVGQQIVYLASEATNGTTGKIYRLSPGILKVFQRLLQQKR